MPRYIGRMALPALARATAFALPRHSPAAVGAAYVALYVFLDWVSFIDPFGPLGITPWNPPPGLSVFVVMRYGKGMLPWLFAAAVLADVFVRGLTAPWSYVAAACAWLAVGYTATTVLLSKTATIRGRIATVRSAAAFMATVVCATFLIGVGYIGIFVVGGVVPIDAFPRTLAQFWIGDVIGIVVTTPFLLALPNWREAFAGRRLETAAQAAAIVAALWLVFGLGIGTELKLFYVLFLPLIWVAMRKGMTGTTVANLVIQVGIILALVGAHRGGEVLDFQFLMLALAATGLFLASAVEERRTAEVKLRDKQFELDRTLRAAAASELASTLAHELNQPLSAVASYTRSCQILLERGDPDRELPSIMDKVVAEANRAGTVVHRLRDLVRSGTIRLETVSPASILDSVAHAARARCARQAFDLRVDSAPDVPDIAGDRIQIELVLHNLISNAIDALGDATGERAIVLSASRHDDERVRFTVADSGPGVTRAVVPTLFEPLASDKARGLGLGLALSRTIVEGHGGTLWLVDAAGGATFCLTIPIAK
jgi:signal transduction histidine kinase